MYRYASIASNNGSVSKFDRHFFFTFLFFSRSYLYIFIGFFSHLFQFFYFFFIIGIMSSNKKKRSAKYIVDSDEEAASYEEEEVAVKFIYFTDANISTIY